MQIGKHLLWVLVCGAGSFAAAQAQNVIQATSVDPHATAEWAIVAPHLPDPVSATPERLETAGDVLRARRFPEDAITFYKAAVLRGGDPGRILKKQGVVHLELHHGLLARLCFQQATKINKRDAEAWNNMGASDYMLGDIQAATGEYRKAVRLNRDSAVFHSNLSLAYFEAHNAKKARAELAKAFAIDPEILHHGSTGGYNLQILASSHYAEICFEMARQYAAQGDQATAISWLTKASERGYDVRAALKNDPQLAPYLQNEQVKVMLANTDQLHSKVPPDSRVRLPSLQPVAVQR